MSEQGWREFIGEQDLDDWVVPVDPAHWTLADRAGNRVDVTAWPDGWKRE